ncbi:hypothetical protein ACOSQ4_004359 [Xanthoceras sorbifolium]
MIQYELLKILVDCVRDKIQEKIGDAKFCILIDESNKEQMAIILRYVDVDGFVRERFFEIVGVDDTNASTLKREICIVKVMMVLVTCGVNGMDYKLCSLNIVHLPTIFIVWLFFSKLSSIVNFVSASATRHSELKLIREDKIIDMIALGELESGTRANQIRTLQRARPTHWSSHFTFSFRNLLCTLSCTINEISRYLKCIEFDAICTLAEKFYHQDFTRDDINALKRQLGHYKLDVLCQPQFQNIASLSELCHLLVQNKNNNRTSIFSNKTY